VLAVDLVMRDDSHRVLRRAATGPPAERGRRGFCIFNSVAIGAAHAMARARPGNVSPSSTSTWPPRQRHRAISRMTPRADCVERSSIRCIRTADSIILPPNMVIFAALRRQRRASSSAVPSGGCRRSKHRPQLILISAGFAAIAKILSPAPQILEADYYLVHARNDAWHNVTHRGAWCPLLEAAYALSALGRSAPNLSRELPRLRAFERRGS